MKPWKIVTAITIAAIATASLAGLAFAMFGPRSLNNYGTYPNGMMGGYYPPASNTPQTPTPSPTQTPPATNPYGGWGWGCRGGRWGWSYGTPANTGATSTIALDSAVQIARDYVASLNNPDLTVAEVEEYTQNFYVAITEKSTGTGAFELLIDKYTGSVGPEMGPNTMWNTKYGLRNGICGWLLGTPMTTPTVSVEQAKANAQQYLNEYYAGTTIGEVTEFYGYYHVEVLSTGKTYGMLSVNANTGQIWFHNWHGAFVQEWTS